ncbi:EthD family reductase [Albimonas sp. CAU 1670]|uniref:EthD family reductase n=1 Tax=Albimonas sp. CAU 1670 TaxID=3032599 RepID=UPI0023DCA681|nr:EthD family reductase [Albimonas sp. CAU 1670]MDF2235556.1 EthD family reductase [Albimonas sp. CAU 1670]
MPITVQAIYPITEGATFDYDYYTSTHLPLVQKHFGPKGLSGISASKGLAGGPGVAPGYFAVATMTFPDEAAMQAALGEAGPVLADIANFTTCQPDLLIGEVIA